MAMKIHEMSQDLYETLCAEYGGICLACGAIHYGGVEPDAENYACDECGEMKVCGAEQALVCGRLTFSDED